MFSIVFTILNIYSIWCTYDSWRRIGVAIGLFSILNSYSLFCIPEYFPKRDAAGCSLPVCSGRYAIFKAKHIIRSLSVMSAYFAVFGLVNAYSAFRTATGRLVGHGASN